MGIRQLNNQVGHIRAEFRVDNPYKGMILVFALLKPKKQYIATLLVDRDSDICMPGDLVRIESEVYYIRSLSNLHNQIIHVGLEKYSL